MESSINKALESKLNIEIKQNIINFTVIYDEEAGNNGFAAKYKVMGASHQIDNLEKDKEKNADLICLFIFLQTTKHGIKINNPINHLKK